MKKRQTVHVTLGLLLVAGATGPVYAEEKPVATVDQDKAVVEEEVSVAEEVEEVAAAATGTIEYGLGYVSDDSYGFGRYTGMQDQGLFLVGDLDMEFRPGRPDYLHFHARDLGLDSRWLIFEYGQQGKLEAHLEYNQLPSFKMDSAQTPYQGVGSDTLTVAPGASPTALLPLKLDTERRRITGGLSFLPQENWKTTFEVRHEEKEGTDWIGGALLGVSGSGGGGGGGGIGRTYAVILPEPVDQTTTEMDASLEYADKRSQWSLNLHTSLFNNANSRLRWEDPGFTVLGGTTLPAEGQLALPPDNRFFQLSFSGATRITDTTRFTGALSIGLMQQDQAFLPYGIDGSAAATAALPRNSLDGEVWVYNARLGLTARPIRPLRLKAKYSYDERDNQTPQASYDYDRLESGSTPSVAAVNEPLSYKKHKLDLDANYRFSSSWKGAAGYEYRHTERDNSDVEESDEHIGSASLQWRPSEQFDGTLRLTRSARDASDYEAELVNQNPLLRKYNLTDRDQTRTGLLLNYAPLPKINFGLSADLINDDYTNSELGLTEMDGQTYNLDVAYYPTQDLQVHAFYTHDRMDSEQLGSDAPVTSLYRVDFKDRVDTLGFGVDIKNAWKSWDLAVNYRYSQGEGDIAHTDLIPAGSATAYPTLSNEMHHLELSARYDLSSKTQLKLATIYEQLSAEDWAVDGVSPYPDNRLLTLGNESEDYDTWAFVVAVRHEF